MSRFLWAPLSVQSREIRLVKILPGEWEDPVECVLSKASLNDGPTFQTLSYAWGDLYNTKPILFNEHVYDVHLSLHSALRRLRACAVTGPMWIDALCINQSDVVEKGHQVNLMKDIYSATAQVYLYFGELEAAPGWEVTSSTRHTHPVIWTGDGRDASKLTLPRQAGEDSLESLIDHLETAMDPLHHLFFILSQLSDRRHLQDIPMLIRKWHSPYRSRIFFVLSKFVASPWWYRTWIVQEAVLPKRVTGLYGHMVFPWELIARAALYFEGHRSSCCSHHTLGSSEVYLIRFVEVSRSIWQRRHTHHKSSNATTSLQLPHLLWQFRSRQAIDDRDKVLGLCALVSDWQGRAPMAADYSLSAPQLYRKVFFDTLAVDRSLTILSGDLRRHNHDELPSWIPDFSAPLLPRAQDNDRVQRSRLFNAAMGTIPAIQLLNQDTITSPAIVADEIISVGEMMWPSEGVDWSPSNAPSEDGFFTSLQPHSGSGSFPTSPSAASTVSSSSSGSRWFSFKSSGNSSNSSSARSKPSSSAVAKLKSANILALRRALCTDCFQITNEGGLTYRRLGPDEEHNLGMWAHLRFNHRSLPNTGSQPVENSRSEECSYSYPNSTIRAIDRSYASATEDSRLFFTRSGGIGLGPRGTAVGDQVAVLWGGRLPFVIRPCSIKTMEGVGVLQTHSLIGGCYMNGIMDGEMMAQKERAGILYLV